MASPAQSVPYRQTFLRHHIERELLATDDVLAVRELIEQLPAALRPGRDDPVRARLLVEFFHQRYPDDRLYIPVRLLPDDDGRHVLAEVRKRTPEERDPLASLTALLRALERSGDHRGVVLCAGSGAGKTVACRRAFLDCLHRDAFARLPGDLLARKDLDLADTPLAGLLPVWLPTRAEASDRAGAHRSESVELLYELLVEASHPDPKRPQGRWNKDFSDRLPQLLGYSSLLLFIDLNAAEDQARRALADSMKQYQERHGKRHGHRVVVTYRSTRSDDPTMNDLRKSGLFLFFDLRSIDNATARGYLRNYREFEKSVYHDVLPAPADYRPPTDAELEEECRSVESLTPRHVRGRAALISTPLLMHLVAGLGRNGLVGVRSLADLYEQVVDRFIKRDLNGPIRSLRLKDGQQGSVMVRAAMTRVALAIQARGNDATRLGSVQELEELLRYPAEGKPGGTSTVTWWPKDSIWSLAKTRPVPYYRQRFQNREAIELLEFGLLRRTGDQIGFLHDSFISYFTGVLGLRHFLGPMLPGVALPRLTTDWVKRIAARVHIDESTWHNSMEFLGGVLTEPEMRLLLLELIPAEPKGALPALIQNLLHGRRPGIDPVLRMLDQTSRLPGLHAVPETLFHQCHDDLEWPQLAEEEVLSCRSMAEQLRHKMTRPWLRCRNRRSRLSVFCMSLHTDFVNALVALPDGRIASGSNDRTVRLWDPITGLIQVMDQHTLPVTALQVLSDGRIVSGSGDHTVRLWDPATGDAPIIVQHTDWVRALAVLPDGRIASAGDDQTVQLWDPATGEVQVMEHAGQVLCLTVLHAGRLAVGSADQMVRLWDTDSGRVRVLTPQVGLVKALATLPDGRLAVGGADQKVRVWDTATGKVEVIDQHGDKLTALAVLPDGGIASGSRDNSVRLWNPTTGQVQIVGQHTEMVTALAAFPDGRLASGGTDNTVRIWDPASAQPQVLVEPPKKVVAFVVLADRRVAYRSGDTRVHLWDPTTGLAHVIVQHTRPVKALAVLSDGRLASASDDGTLRLWDPASGDTQVMDKPTEPVTPLAVLPNGRIAFQARDHTLRLWDPASAQFQVMNCQTGWVTDVGVLSNGHIVSASDDGTLRLWDPASGQVRVMDKHTEPVTALAVLPDGRIASGSVDNTVRLWDPANGLIQVMDQHSGWVRSLAVVSDSRIASASADKTVRLWDPFTGRIQVMDQHTNQVSALAALPDGRIASGSQDGTVRLWEPRSAATTVFDASSQVCSICWTITDTHTFGIVAGTESGKVMLLELQHG